MKRVIVLLLDSFGIGASQDASQYGDQGANTLLHIAEACAKNQANDHTREGLLKLPHLASLGLAHATMASCGNAVPGLWPIAQPGPKGAYGYAVEVSTGKDTPSGHWEIAGVPVLTDFGYFTAPVNSFPPEIVDRLIKEGALAGVLGNKQASGTEIIKEFGEEHIHTGKPILYTSADSVLQLAAHETAFGLERLYDLCLIARDITEDYRIGRVIARPFAGQADHFYRTSNRRDYTLPPPAPTLFDYVKEAGMPVVAIGKTSDIFAHQGVSEEHRTKNNMDTLETTIRVLEKMNQSGLIFSNFTDFDTLFGHRRNVIGYAHALEEFDRHLPKILDRLMPEDLVIITADHGCDPTFQGSDHTREHIPILAYGPSMHPNFIGRRETFADIGQSIAKFLGIRALDSGVSFL